MKLMTIDKLKKTFGDELVLNNLSFDVLKGECLSIVGRSGRGKSTLLNILSGHDDKYSGRIETDMKLEPSLDKAYIYQGVEQLFPWMTVKENIEFPMRKKGISQDVIDTLTQELLTETELKDHMDKYPKALSGGMKQRTILARAVGYSPKIILLDEPFSHLDDRIKERLQDLLLDLKDKHQLTMIFVTHDLHEAIKVSDRILVMGKNIDIFECENIEVESDAYWQIYKELSALMRKE